MKYCLLQLSPSISPIILGPSYVFSCVKLYRAGKYWGRKLRFVEKYLLPLPTLCVSECFFVFFHSLDLHMSPLKIKTKILSLCHCWRLSNLHRIHHLNTTPFVRLIYLTDRSYLKVVSATFSLVCFLSRKESTCETRKSVFISLQKLFLFSRKSNFRILDILVSWRYQMPKHKTRNAFFRITRKANTVR